MTTITINSSNTEKRKTAVKLLKNAVSREQEILKVGLANTLHNFEGFEKKYDMPSKKFYELYEKGELDDRNDFIDWAGELRIYQSLQEQIEVLKELKI